MNDVQVDYTPANERDEACYPSIHKVHKRFFVFFFFAFHKFEITKYLKGNIKRKIKTKRRKKSAIPKVNWNIKNN